MSTRGIKCGHCSSRDRAVYHPTTKDVAFCAFQHQRRATHLANVRAQIAPAPRPNEWQVKTPRPMVENMREGRYAVPHPGTAGETKDQHTFLRVWRPTKGKRKGQLLVRTQHSDAYKDFITIYPSGSVWFAQTNERLDMALMVAAADPYTSAMRYAQIFKVCSRCGKQLTDNRSRWYGIGPECEGYWPEIITYINETRGRFGS